MKTPTHTTAKPSHYDDAVERYDEFNEENSRNVNELIERILKEHNAHSVLDMTCGTGSQVFWLVERGFDVVGSDINSKMLEVARKKAIEKGLDINFVEDDMRTAQLGSFDAIITIFNAVGHLTKADFKVAMKNIHSSLNPGGIYVFDIFNLSYLLNGENITKLTIDVFRKVEGQVIRYIQHSTIDRKGILASYTTSLEEMGDGGFAAEDRSQTLQVYTAGQLTSMLKESGFKVLRISGDRGECFSEIETERMFIVAQRVDDSGFDKSL